MNTNTPHPRSDMQPRPPFRGPNRLRRAAASLCLAPVVASAPAGAQDFSAVDERTREMLERFPFLEGAGVLVSDRDGVLHEAYFGAYDETTRVPLASASKLVSAVAVMTLVEEGRLNRFAPIRDYVPEFAPATAGLRKSALTIDQCYGMTNGFPPDQTANQILGDLSLTLADAVRLIAERVPLVVEPSTELIYSGSGMHVVGRACEVVTGQSFADFFDDAVNIPLGINITWDGLGETQNYRPGGGAAAGLRDYGVVVRALLRRGEAGGVRLLEPATVETMFVERTVGLPIGSAPPQAAERGYGYAFGMWVEERDGDGRPAVLTSPGAFGFTPVLDLQDDYAAVIMVRGSNARLLDDLDAIRGEIDAAMNQPCRRADLNGDAANTLDDILLFAAAFSPITPDPRADMNGDGANNLDDVLLFVAAFEETLCPAAD